MPERTTMVGNDFTATFDHCNASFCSEKPIQYSAPMPQLKLLLEKSPSCSQSIKFDCQLAQIVVSFLFLFLFFWEASLELRSRIDIIETCHQNLRLENKSAQAVLLPK